ncbi:hypothetical protein ABT369_39010 [Dactylosporangium sp. NPDC000244]|uniref:hypothetical protein n=1 Tax=Dactylosporangium sp. NPDC000244 TaxID=3154365 RepID=UPI0033280BE4
MSGLPENERFGLPDGYAENSEKALDVLIRHGEVEAARIFVAERRDKYPAYGAHLAEKYAAELAR